MAGLSIRQLKVGPVYRINPVERYEILVIQVISFSINLSYSKGLID